MEATQKQINFIGKLKEQLKEASITIDFAENPTIKDASLFIGRALKALKNVSNVTVKKEKQIPINKYGVKVGDVFCSSWGYEQTNVEFFQVVEILSATKIVLKEVKAQEVKCYSSMTGTVKPVKDDFVEYSYSMCYEKNNQEKNKYLKIVQKSKYDDNIYISFANSRYRAYLTDWNKEHHVSSYA